MATPWHRGQYEPVDSPYRGAEDFFWVPALGEHASELREQVLPDIPDELAGILAWSLDATIKRFSQAVMQELHRNDPDFDHDSVTRTAYGMVVEWAGTPYTNSPVLYDHAALILCMPYVFHHWMGTGDIDANHPQLLALVAASRMDREGK